jgi:hypothetical protein
MVCGVWCVVCGVWCVDLDEDQVKEEPKILHGGGGGGGRCTRLDTPHM